MSAIEPRYYVLHDEKLRSWVALFVLAAPLGCVVMVEPARRSKAQNALLHALISEAVAGGIATDDGRRLTLEEEKVAFVSGWMIEEGRLLGFHDFEHFARWCPGCFGIIVGSIATAVTMSAARWLLG